MPGIAFGLSSYQRGPGDMPDLPVINMWVEESPTEERQIVLQSRPGIEDREEDMGEGPVQQLFQRDLVLDSALFGVSDNALFEGTTSLGAVDGAGPFSIAGYENFLFVAGGSGLWGWNATVLAEIAFPDNADVIKVIIAASRVIAIRKDTGTFYWSDVLETDIEALDFATAENQPDRLLDCLFIDDILVLFGAETVEFWPNTQDGELPFQPLQGRVIEKGIRGTGCATALGSTFAWVTNENNICIGDENTIVSNPGLQAKIEGSASVSLFTFTRDGVEFLALRLSDETHVYQARSGTWSEMESHGQTNWIAQCFAGGVFGSAIDGRTLAFSDGHEDLGGVLERRWRAGFWAGVGTVIANLIVRCNVGQTPYLDGDYTAPMLEARVSWDHGKTWGNWRQVSLGEQGQYGVNVVWRSLGMARRWFAALFEFRLTAPVDLRVSNVLVNEGYGGR